MYVINKYAERVRIRLRSMVDLFFQKFNRDIITAVFVGTFKSKFSF